MTPRSIAMVTVVVDDYDAALAYYTGCLGMTCVEDKPMQDGKRWVVVAPKGEGGCRLLLAQAANDEQRQAIGNQTGGRVFLFLETDDFDRDHARFKSRGVNFIEPTRSEPYGKVAVFEDLYGNRWDLIEPAHETTSTAKKETTPC